MQIGLIGAGNMARALARGWESPVVCSDPLGERAQALVEEVGGEVLASNLEVARRADIVVLCHKPSQLAEVATEIAADARAVISILAATPLGAVRDAYPGIPAYRVVPSLAAEVRSGAIVIAAGATEDPALDELVVALFARLGTVVSLEDRLLDVATGLMSCGPAYGALVVEAQVDAGVRRGIAPAQAAAMVVQTMRGTADLLAAREFDTLALRREVSSPGGLTARGVDALERGGLRIAFSDALDASLRVPQR